MTSSRIPKWNFGRYLGLVAALLAGSPVEAIHLSAVAPPILLVDQVAATDSSGTVRSDVRVARIAVPGSTGAGLLSDWSLAFGKVLPNTDLAVIPLPWRDPVGRPTAQLPLGGVPGIGRFLPGGVATSLLGRPSLLDQATRHFGAQAAGLALRLGAVLKAEGLQEAWFSYRQQLSRGGQTQPLAWSLHVSASGTWFASDPAYDSTEGGTLKVRYVSLQAAQGLPADLAYRDGGWLTWQLVNAAGSNTDRLGARDTHGVFDSLDGLGCLLGVAHVHCLPQEPGLDVLADEVGATQVELDYFEVLTPDYVPRAGGVRLAPLWLQVTRLVESADQRCVSAPLHYVNVFQASFRLRARVDHFVRSPSGSWSRTVATQALRTSLQPWRTRRIALTANDLPGLSQRIVDPDSGQLTLISAYPQGIQDIQAGPVECRASSSLP